MTKIYEVSAAKDGEYPIVGAVRTIDELTMVESDLTGQGMEVEVRVVDELEYAGQVWEFAA